MVGKGGLGGAEWGLSFPVTLRGVEGVVSATELMPDK